MNPLPRSLPPGVLWRCLPGSVNSGGSCLPRPPVPRHTHLLQYRPERTVHVLVSSVSSRERVCVVQVVCKKTFHAGPRLRVEHKLKPGIDDCFTLLGVEEDCSDQTLREAYLHHAKLYHPDSPSASADPHKFTQVKDAYRSILEHRKGRELEEEEEKEADIVFDIKHTAPQHRQYLEFEGVGMGTPSQRQRQYQQHRVARVTENVFQHRIQKLAAETEDSLVIQDKRQAKKTVISNAIERMVEDLIQESMKRGEFNNLAGQGQPLDHTAHNPFVDVTTHNLNKIMANNGFAPEWIMLQSEIRKELQHARQSLAVSHHRLTEPSSPTDSKAWRAARDKFGRQVNEINAKIHKFNLIVPFLDKQMVLYQVEREVQRVQDNIDDYLPQDTHTHTHLLWDVTLPTSAPLSAGPAVNWRQVWRDIKGVFIS